MPEFTTVDRQSQDFWLEMFEEAGMVGKPALRFLEVGCYEGRTTLWLIENVLTHESSSITVVDIFFREDYTDRFNRNLAEHIESGKVKVKNERSEDALCRLVGPFDFVYVDANHEAPDVLTDAVLSFLLLRQGGIMVFDDYIWPGREDAPLVKLAVDAFVTCFEPLIEHEQRGVDHYVVIKR